MTFSVNCDIIYIEIKERVIKWLKELTKRRENILSVAGVSREYKTGEKYFIFGKKGGQTLADEFSAPLLAQIPLIKEVGELAEQGKAFSALDNKDLKLVFEQLAEVVVAFCEEKK